jgi:hypothetical protein
MHENILATPARLSNDALFARLKSLAIRERDATVELVAHLAELGGRCAFAGRSGRCTERRFLEWHHVQPHGHQGPATVDNISLRCRAHNVYESELLFGRFDPSAVREPAEIYAVSREIAPFRNGAASACPGDGASNGSRTDA